MRDDTPCLQEIVNRQKASGRIVLPPGEFHLRTTLELVDLDAFTLVEMMHTTLWWKTDGPGPILRIGGSASGKGVWAPRLIGGNLYAYRGDMVPWTVTGLELVNVQQATVSLDGIAYCDTGVRMIADGRPCAYNTDLCFKQVGARVGLEIVLKNGGWANHNAIQKTKFACVHDDTTLIKLPNGPTGLTFNNCCFEGQQPNAKRWYLLQAGPAWSVTFGAGTWFETGDSPPYDGKILVRCQADSRPDMKAVLPEFKQRIVYEDVK